MEPGSCSDLAASVSASLSEISLFSLAHAPLLAYVRSKARPLNFEELLRQDVPVLYVGESHPDGASKIFLAQNMVLLKKSGITHIGMEMFNSNRQPLLNEYFAGRASRNDVLDLLDGEWGWRANDYMKLVDSAMAEGIQIVALNGRHLLKLMPKQSHSSELKFRDEHMASVLADLVLKTPNAKVLALVGFAHARYDSSSSGEVYQPQILLGSKNIGSVSYIIDYLDPRFSGNKSPLRVVKGPIRTAVEDSGLSSQWLFLPVPREKALCDGYIFIDALSSVGER